MIIVNGKEMSWQAGMTISDIIKNIKIIFPQYIVSVNDQRVPPDEHDAYCIEDHSKIKILYVCHGG